MADNPILSKGFKLHLNFKFPYLGMHQISELVGFDAFSFNLVQQEGRFGRDKSIGAKEIDLQFWKYYGTETYPKEYVRTQLNGTVNYHYDHCFDLILEAKKQRGSEAVIEFIVEIDGSYFVNGILNMPDAKFTFNKVSCSVIQDTNKSMIERKADLKVNVFDTRDTFLQDIPIFPKKRLLLRAVPFFQKSTWKYSYQEPRSLPTLNGVVQNLASASILSGIERSLSFIPGNDEAKYFKYITAFNELTRVSIKLTNVNVVMTFGSPTRLKLRYGIDIDTAQDIDLEVRNTAGAFQTSYTYDIPVLTRGESIWIYFKTDILANLLWTSFDVEITAVSRSVDTITDFVNYFDFMERGVKMISKLPSIGEDFKTGEFSKQAIITKDMMALRPDAKLFFKFKDEANDLSEVNADYQINDDNVELLTFPDFYVNKELLVAHQVPEKSIEETVNKRLKKNAMTFGWDKYEQGDDANNTNQAFNTELQKLFPNESANDKLEVKIKKVRDSFLRERAKKETSKKTTVTTNDETIFIEDYIDLAPGTQKQIIGAYLIQIQGGLIKVLSTDEESEENTLSWLTTGMKNGDEVTFYYTLANGTRLGGRAYVLQMSDSVLELNPDFVVSDFTDNSKIEITYFLTDVFYQNRTIEGFTDISNLDGAQYIGNQKYSPERLLNLPAWSSYLHTICEDREEGTIITNYFKSNGAYTSKFGSERVIRQDEDVLVSSLFDKILSKWVVKFKLAMDFYTASNLLNGIKDEKGFISILSPSGDENFPYMIRRVHPTDMSVNWAKGIFEGQGEVRHESDFVSITSGSETGKITVLDLGYDGFIDTSFDWYKEVEGFVQIFRNGSEPLINPTRFEMISINGVFYTDVIEFDTALAAL